MRYFLIWLAFLFSAAGAEAEVPQYPHQGWTRNASIYEVNIRQYTPEGTITAFEKQLPRLKKMGVKILWIMPVQPIGVRNRKGTMGSYYSIKDYTAVNPEFGTQTDFNAMVKSAHRLGMKVILDWVANHTAWDHAWTTAHPDWYKKNATGEITSYEYNNGREIEYWTDVIGLDYAQAPLHDAMIEAMLFWVREADIDGFRCDVAGLVPTSFWIKARAALEREKPMFMLAESDDASLHVAFDMTYDWKLLDAFSEIVAGKGNAATLRAWLATGQLGFPTDAYRMTFTSNHDVNSWRWGDTEHYSDKFRTFAVLAATLPGMPLIYSGQESGLDRKIAFFEKDAINWKTYGNAVFYRRLMQLKARHPALRNGAQGGTVEVLLPENNQVFAFRRKRAGRQIVVAANLSASPVTVSDAAFGKKPLTLTPWAYVLRDGKN
jgi:glycosidase